MLQFVSLRFSYKVQIILVIILQTPICSFLVSKKERIIPIFLFEVVQLVPKYLIKYETKWSIKINPKVAHIVPKMDLRYQRTKKAL